MNKQQLVMIQVITMKSITLSLLFLSTALLGINGQYPLPNPLPLTFINGFMPECDCEMDVFKIKGVEDYPENDLLIFDANGIEIYHKEGYKNEWHGDCEDGSITKGDVLFYLFDDGEGKTYSGILKVD